MAGIYSTERGICHKGNHLLEGREYRGLILAYWKDGVPVKTRNCKEHYLEEWREVYPNEPLPDLSPQPAI